MKLVNLNGDKNADPRRAVVNRTISNLVPSAARAAAEAQETVIQHFKKILDNRFHLIQGLRFAGLEEPAPLLLIGPAGIWILEASPLSGIFRAAGDQLEEMDPKAQSFRPARQNPMRKTQAAMAAMQAMLDETGEDLPPVEGAALFTHPGAHLEAQQPAVRLIQADAIARFAAGLLHIRPTLEPDAARALAERLAPTDQPAPTLDAADLLPEIRPTPRPAPIQPPRLPNIPEEEPELVKRIAGRLSFSRYQWSVIALLFFLNLLVLIAAIVIILIIT